MSATNNDQLNNGYLSRGILGKIYYIIDKMGYKFFNHNSSALIPGNKLLFINLGLIGDLLLFRYVIEDFLNLNYEIDVLIQDKYKFIFSNCPKINIITIKNYKDKKIFSGFYKIFSKLRKNNKKYDVSCHFRGYLGTGIVASYVARSAHNLIGYGTSGFGFLLNKVALWQIQVHETEHLLNILRMLQPDYHSINLNIFDNLPQNNCLERFALSSDSYIVIHATSQDMRKNIPQGILCKILEYVQQTSALKIVFVGSKTEIDYIIQSFPNNFSNYLITNGKLEFFDLRYLIKYAKLFIGIDSSIAHLIGNIKIPKIILWHQLNSFKQWQPLGIDYTTLKNNNSHEILEVIKKHIKLQG